MQARLYTRKRNADADMMRKLFFCVIKVAFKIKEEIKFKSSDLFAGDLENLSSNLGTNLKLERESPEAQGNRGGSDSRRGSNNRGGGGITGGQSAQLDTPDVSCNLDESAKKNNLNR